MTFHEKVQVTFNDTEKDIYDYIGSLGSKKATVIKNIIREQMTKNKENKLEQKIDTLIHALTVNEAATVQKEPHNK